MYDGDSLDAVVCLVRDAAARGASTRRRRRHVFVRRFVGRDATPRAHAHGGVRGGAGTVGGVVGGYREDASRAGSYPGDEHHARVDSGVGARRRGREEETSRCSASPPTNSPPPAAVNRSDADERTEIYTARRHRGVEASPGDARGTSGGARRRRGGRRGRRPGQTRRRERRARRRARPRNVFGAALRDGDEDRGNARAADRETRRCDEDRETRRCDEDAVVSYASGAFLDYTGRTRAFARRELASCDAWPQLAATLREFRRGASRRGGARRRAQRLGRRRVLGRTGDRLRRVGDSTRGATGGGGGDGTRGGGGGRRRTKAAAAATAADGGAAAATTRTHPRTHPRRLSIFCASRGVRPACRRARLCSRTFASRPTTIRIPTSIRIRARKRRVRRYSDSRDGNLRVFRGTWRAVRRPARTRRSSGRYPRSMHSRRRAREP